MDVLLPGQRLRINEELCSNNTWLRLVLQGDGNLVLYRAQSKQPLWASGTDGRPAALLVMQQDGNLVIVGDHGTPYWSSGTWGHAGAYAVLQNDGNLVVYDQRRTALWSSHTVTDFNSPTIMCTDTRGYSFVETSESWQQSCRILPCFAALQCTGYATRCMETTVEGQSVVVQLWKGWCQKFLGIPSFPGGVGAEVGIYRRVPGHIRPASFPFLTPPLEAFFLAAMAAASDRDLWWPAPDLHTHLHYTLINPLTAQPLFAAGDETSYWLCKWMNEASYLDYAATEGFGKVPFLPTDYILEYSINGTVNRW